MSRCRADIWSQFLHRVGFTCTRCHQNVCGLLPRISTLTTCVAVYFCCTFLKVAFTGRYPALLLCGARTFLVRSSHATVWLSFTVLLYDIFAFVSIKKSGVGNLCTKLVIFRHAPIKIVLSKQKISAFIALCAYIFATVQLYLFRLIAKWVFF